MGLNADLVSLRENTLTRFVQILEHLSFQAFLCYTTQIFVSVLLRNYSCNPLGSSPIRGEASHRRRQSLILRGQSLILRSEQSQWGIGIPCHRNGRLREAFVSYDFYSVTCILVVFAAMLGVVSRLRPQKIPANGILNPSSVGSSRVGSGVVIYQLNLYRFVHIVAL